MRTAKGVPETRVWYTSPIHRFKGPGADRLKLAGVDPESLERYVSLSAHQAMLAIERDLEAARRAADLSA